MRNKGRIARHFNRSKSENITKSIFLFLFLFVSFIFLYPIIYCLISSFRSQSDIAWGVTSLFPFPSEADFSGWSNLFKEFHVEAGGSYVYYGTMLWNSVWFTILKVVLSLAASTALAYACAKYRFPGKKLIYATVIFVQTIPIFGSSAASLKLFNTLGIINQPWFFWIAWVTGFDMSFIIMYGAFKNMSDAYSEAARIDGANDWTILVRVILPMAFPILLALMVTNSLTVWNEFSTMQIYLSNYPNLAYGLYKYGLKASSTPGYFAAMIITMLPITIIYASSQKLVLKNVSVGGLKG